jgi:hypothetical protein
MEKKFFIMGFNEACDFPVFKDKEAYSWRDASIKAKEYFEHRGFLKKVVIFEQEQGDEEKIAKLVFKNVFGKIEEIDVWKLPNINRNR